MMPAAKWRRWLPTSVVARAVDEAPVPRVVADWSAAWFAGMAPRARSAVAVTAREQTAGGWALADGVTLVPDADVEARLVSALFGQASTEPLTSADEEALSSVAATCLADLRSRLAEGFAAGDATWRLVLGGEDAPDGREWRVDLASQALLHVRVDDDCLSRRWCARLPSAPPAALTPLSSALAAQPVGVGAVVGRSRVTTGELAQLAAGDVVVLDRATDAPAALAVDRVATALPCAIVRGDDGLSLLLVD